MAVISIGCAEVRSAYFSMMRFLSSAHPVFPLNLMVVTGMRGKSNEVNCVF